MFTLSSSMERDQDYFECYCTDTDDINETVRSEKKSGISLAVISPDLDALKKEEEMKLARLTSLDSAFLRQYGIYTIPILRSEIKEVQQELQNIHNVRGSFIRKISFDSTANKKKLVDILLEARHKLKSIYEEKGLQWEEQQKQKLKTSNNDSVSQLDHRIKQELKLLSFKNTECYKKSKRRTFHIRKEDCVLPNDNNNDINSTTQESIRSVTATVVSGSTCSAGHKEFNW